VTGDMPLAQARSEALALLKGIVVTKKKARSPTQQNDAHAKTAGRTGE
jgi:hypothetical protein